MYEGHIQGSLTKKNGVVFDAEFAGSIKWENHLKYEKAQAIGGYNSIASGRPPKANSKSQIALLY